MSETLMLINPKRRSAGRKKPRSAAQKRATAKMLAANRSRRSPKRRSNPLPAVAANPKRRRRSALRSVARTTSRRRRRNPISLSRPLAMLMPALKGAGGALAVNAALNYLPLPAVMTTGRVRYATKIALALALGHFGKRFLGNTAVQMAEGALVVTLADALKDVVGGATGLQLGDSEGIAYYSPAQVAEYMATPGVGMYLNGNDNASEGYGVGSDQYQYMQY